MYFAWYRLPVGALNIAKRAKIGQNDGQKYKIAYFEATFPFETL